MGKRLDTGRPGYLVLCWVYPYEGEAVTAELDRRLQDYDEKISSDIATRTPVYPTVAETILDNGKPGL